MDKAYTERGKLLEIALRIKEMREISGFSVDEMAEKTDTTPAEYRRFEPNWTTTLCPTLI